MSYTNDARFYGSGRDAGVVIENFNTYRNKALVDAEKTINKQVIEIQKKQLDVWSDIDVVQPQDRMTEQQQYDLTKLFQSFINELDIQFQSYYDDESVEKTNSGFLIPKWNSLVNYYNRFVSKNFINYINNMFNMGDTKQKINILNELATENYYTDALEIENLYNNVMKQNYKPIQHILFSKEGEYPTRFELPRDTKSIKKEVERMREKLRDELDKYEENSAEEERILDEMDEIDRLIASLDED